MSDESKKQALREAAQESIKQMETLSEEERKQLIEKFKTQLSEEDEEDMMVFASLVFTQKT